MRKVAGVGASWGERILLLRVRYFFLGGGGVRRGDFLGGQDTERIARFFLERKFYREGETEKVAGCDIEIFIRL